MLEGVLKVYWGLKVPVTLASHNLSYWRRRSQKEQNGILRNTAVKNKDTIVSKYYDMILMIVIHWAMYPQSGSIPALVINLTYSKMIIESCLFFSLLVIMFFMS